MGSESTLKLPVIDFSDIDSQSPGTNTQGWNSVRTQVREALEEYGCFEAVYNQVPAELHESVFGALEELFNLPVETKIQSISRLPYHGYLGNIPTVPLYESMGIDDTPILEHVESFTSVMWPQGNAKFCNTIHSYSKQVSELDQIVRRMVLESLGVEKLYKDHIESTNYVLRVMKYKGPDSNEAELGLTSHTDKNMVTILNQNQVDGLEIKMKNGEWIKVKPSSPNSFTVMIGDSFLAWTNGRLHSSEHRVMMSGNETRYSTGLFSVPKVGYLVKAPEELIDEEHPLLYKPYDFAEFIDFYFKQVPRDRPHAMQGRVESLERSQQRIEQLIRGLYAQRAATATPPMVPQAPRAANDGATGSVVNAPVNPRNGEQDGINNNNQNNANPDGVDSESNK